MYVCLQQSRYGYGDPLCLQQNLVRYSPDHQDGIAAGQVPIDIASVPKSTALACSSPHHAGDRCIPVTRFHCDIIDSRTCPLKRVWEWSIDRTFQHPLVPCWLSCNSITHTVGLRLLSACLKPHTCGVEQYHKQHPADVLQMNKQKIRPCRLARTRGRGPTTSNNDNKPALIGS